ncbi:phosphate ABC transporter permease subunit PstC [Gryllotalpicola sp.]|uniref:phosphate ABC transporter permease subunit PstC n=1 Tax=Gryllotalpicola sp. TaxID=1932787 RepID=UPI002618507C|nr:phosphate ABC transporter permease subunit PstC [Gryllotalpicola sp.]
MTQYVAPRPGSSGARRLVGGPRPSDRIFRGLSYGSAALIMVILAGVAVFLIIKAAPAIAASWSTGDLASGTTAGYANFWAYSGPLIWGTLWMSFIGLLIGAPVAVGIALFISHYAPRSLAGILGYLVDLLAAVPSIIFGLWGIAVIRPYLLPFSHFLTEYLGWFPPFGGQVSTTGSTVLAGAVVLGVMVLPIITSITREIFLQTPRLHEEAALALGATKWETVRLAVFPYARSGMVSAILLGLGRALGETMAIALIISPSIVFSVALLTENQNSQTIAANIAVNFPESNDLQRAGLIGTGLMLFVISFAVNFAARWIVGRTGGSAKERRSRKIAPPSDAASILTLDVAASPLEALEPRGSSAHPEGQEPSIPELRD